MQNDPHYLRSIVDLAERRRVMTHRPIHAENSMKLIDAGIHISTRLYDKLVMHKLLPPIDDCLTIEDAVTPDSLANEIGELLDEDSFAGLLAGQDERDRIVGTFGQINLNPSLAFKLTVAREEFPAIFRHSLEVAVCATLIARHTRTFPGKHLLDAAAAGLFHDLGLLHVDPGLLASHGRLREQDRQYIYSHPVVATLILSGFSEWHPLVSRAVLEHHERMDGSGYPKGLSGTAISPLGQLLAVAEIMATLISERRSAPLDKHAQVILCLNQGKLNPEYAETVMALILQRKADADTATAGGADYAETLSGLVALAESIQHWHAIAPGVGSLPVVETIASRIEMLERNLADLGIDLRNWGMIDATLSEAGEALRELSAAAREGRWQLRAVAQEVERHWPQGRPGNHQVHAQIRAWTKRIENL